MDPERKAVFCDSTVIGVLTRIVVLLAADHFLVAYYPIRPHQDVRRNCQADLLRRFQIYHELKFRRLLHSKICWLSTFQNLVCWLPNERFSGGKAPY